MIGDIVKRFDPLPVTSKLIIFGGGFSGQHLASACIALGNKVLCSRRKKNSQGADFGANYIIDYNYGLYSVSYKKTDQYFEYLELLNNFVSSGQTEN